MIDTDNLLLTLAWLGEVSTADLQRLYLPDYQPERQYACLHLLRELRREGYVTRRMWYVMRTTHPRHAPTPVRQPALWSLTRQGIALVRQDVQFPASYLGPRARRSVPHDTMTTAFITRLVELGRATKAGLSGLYVEREVQLNPPHRRPIMDALIMVTRGGVQTGALIVPWTNDRVYGGEDRQRYALENDRDSEALSVIAGKADSYRSANTEPWRKRNGEFPTPIWLAPSERRLRAICAAWAERWPGGKWLMTTDAWLEGDYFLEYDAGRHGCRGLFRDTPTLPPSTAARANAPPPRPETPPRRPAS